MEDLTSAQQTREVISRNAHMVRHPRGSYIMYPLLSLGVPTPQKINEDGAEVRLTSYS